MELATRFIPDFESHSSDPLAIIGLIMLVIIFAAVAFIGHDSRKTQRAPKMVVLRRMICPVCQGTKTIDSQKCGRCSGVGTILML